MADNAIETISGAWFNYDCPSANVVRIADVAHALGFQCRFSGHTKRFYSVAEHCLNVRSYPDIYDGGPGWRLAALLHDASEAYVVDLPSPLKHRPGMDEYKRVERGTEVALLDSLYLLDHHREELRDNMHSERMKTADIAVTLAERDALLNHRSDHPWEYDKLRLAPAKLIPFVTGVSNMSRAWLRTFDHDLQQLRGEQGAYNEQL